MFTEGVVGIDGARFNDVPTSVIVLSSPYAME